MKKLNYIIFLFFLTVPQFLSAQEDEWDVYMAQYDTSVGSTLINMSLKSRAPISNFPFLVVTGVLVNDCNSDGMPTKAQFPELYVISDSIKLAMDKAGENILAGTFTYQCKRLDYYYLKDTLGIRDKLKKVYRNKFKAYKHSISITEDKSWEQYLTFLYPPDETFEYMQNTKVVTKLEKAGDNLEKERKIDHWLFFTTEADRDCFVSYIQKKGFNIESKEKATDLDRPYKLQISKVDKVDITSISVVTMDLRKQAKTCNGIYDGWETFVVK